MRVLTWNLWWTFGPKRHHAIEEILRRENADVLFLQETIEAEGQAETLAAALGLHVARTSLVEHGGRGMANAILSRWPILEPTQTLLPAAADRPKVRTILSGFLATPWGKWPVATTHLDHSFDASVIRLAQVDTVADVVHAAVRSIDGTLPAIIGGDFNAVPDSDEIRRLTGRSAVRHRGLVFADVWELRGEGRGNTWDGSNPYLADANWPNRRIDYLFVTWPRPKPAGHPERVWLAGSDPVDGVTASDHLAVVADLRVPAQSTR